MRKLRSLLACAVVLSSSCSSTASTAPAAGGTTFTYKVDGVAKTIDSANAVVYTLGVAPFGREVDIFAYSGGNQVLEFHFRPTVGSLAAAADFTHAWLSYNPTPLLTFDSQSGNLTLTSADTIGTTGLKFAGTFNFVGLQFGGVATHTITEGNMVVTRVVKNP